MMKTYECGRSCSFENQKLIIGALMELSQGETIQEALSTEISSGSNAGGELDDWFFNAMWKK
jgi:hypothetical protein